MASGAAAQKLGRLSPSAQALAAEQGGATFVTAKLAAPTVLKNFSTARPRRSPSATAAINCRAQLAAAAARVPLGAVDRMQGQAAVIAEVWQAVGSFAGVLSGRDCRQRGGWCGLLVGPD